MHCALCNATIEKYDATFNHLTIDDERAVDICNPCIEKFVAWQGKKISLLFPTRTMKKIYKK